MKLMHVIYKCYNHIIWNPKTNFRVLKGQIKTLLEDMRMLCDWKQCAIEKLSVQEDHIHFVVLVTRVSDLMWILKEKIAIKLFNAYPKIKQNPFWARGYFFTKVGVDEVVIK